MPVATFSEGVGSVSFSFGRPPGPTNQTVWRTITFSSGSAVSGLDFNGYTQTLFWGPNQFFTQSLSLPIIDDNVYEGPNPETFILTNDPSHDFAFTVEYAIEDNDPVPTVRIASAGTATEGEAAQFTLVLSNSSYEAITVRLDTFGTDAEPGDWDNAPQFVTFAPGETQKIVDVDTLQDLINEPDEHFAGTLSVVGGTAIPIGSSTNIATIADDDPNHPPVAIDDALGALEDTPVTYPATALVGNDTDADGHALTIASVSGAVGGSVVLNPNGTVTFTPTANFSGAGSFDYEVSDGQDTDLGTVTVNVAPVNDAPVVTIAIRNGGEARANATTSNDQSAAAIGALSGGGYVVAWHSMNQDGSGWGIFAQRYDSAGIAQGGQFQVNSFAADHQINPSVAGLVGGGFAISWMSLNQDGNSWGIYHRVYDLNGAQMSGEWLANVTTAGGQQDPSVTPLLDGTFMVFWETQFDGNGYGIMGRRFAPNGAPISNEFPVNTTVAGDQLFPMAVTQINNLVLVAWQSAGQDGSGYGIYGRILNSSGGPVTGEFQVSTTSSGDQTQVAAGALSDGSFVVAWQSPNQDGDGFGIYARRFQLNGVPIGGEFLVNSHIAGNQSVPAVTGLSGGGFIISWQSEGGQDGSDSGIYAQRFDNSGARVGGEYLVNTTTANGQFGAAAAGLTGGRYVIGWTSTGQDGDLGGVYAQRYASRFLATEQVPIDLKGAIFVTDVDAGAADITVTLSVDHGILDVTVGTSGADVSGSGTDSVTLTGTLTEIEALLNTDGASTVTYTANADAPPSQAILTVTANDGGATGTDPGLTGDGTSEEGSGSAVIEIAAVNDAPVVTIAPGGFEVQINETTAGDQIWSRAAPLPGGGYVVVWHSANQDGSGLGVYARRYDASGVPLGGEVQVNTTVAGDQVCPAVAALSDGGYVVTWFAPDGSGQGVFAQRYDADGVPQGGETQVNTHSPNNQDSQSVAGLAGGGYVVAWQSNGQDGSNLGVYARRYDASGAPQGAEQLVNTTTLSVQRDPSVAALSGGGYVIAWHAFNQDGDNFGIFAQRYDSSGVPQGGEFQVNTTTSGEQRTAIVAGLEGGGFVVVWWSQDGSGFGVYSQRYDAAGVPQGGETQVNTTTAGDQSDAQLTALSDGGYLVVWTSAAQDGSGSGIYSRRFDASGSPQSGEVLVNTTTADNQERAFVAALANGGYLVTWTSFGQDGSGSGVFAQRFSNGLLANEQEPLNLKGTIAVSDVDAGAADIIVTLSVDHGILDVTAGGSGAEVSGSGTDSVTITGTLAEIEALLGTDGTSTVTYTADSDAPPADATLTVTANDGGATGTDPGLTGDATSEEGSDSAIIAITAVNDVPLVDLNGGGDGTGATLAYTENAAATAVAPATTVTDPDLADFAGGTLTIAFTSGGTADDRLSILNQGTGSGQVSMGGGQVGYEGALIGTFIGGGNGSTPLVITFIASADAEAVQAVVRAISFANVSNNPATAARSLSYTLTDGDGGTSPAATATVNLTAVNDAPTGANATITVAEDESHVLVAENFGFSDAAEGHGFAGIIVTSLPGAGMLTLDGGAVEEGDFVTEAAIAAGELVFTPAADTNGIGYAAFNFQVRDNGGTDNGGQDTDQSADTLTFDVTAVNDAPTLGNLDGDSVTWTEDDGAVLLDDGLDALVTDVDSADFAGGSLTVSGGGGQQIENFLGIGGDGVEVDGVVIGTVTSDGAQFNDLVIEFNANATPARVQELIRRITYLNINDIDPDPSTRTYTFTLVDGDGDEDSAGATVTVNIATVNDEPAGDDNTITIGEDAVHTFRADSGLDDFNFSDPDFNQFDSVILTSLPANGDLYLNGVPITVAGTSISVFNINSGLLTFQADPNGNGAGYASFTFQVKDDGGTANGGQDTDQSANTITLDVTPVNDAPVIDLNGGGGGDSASLTYTENDAATALAPAATVSDIDSTDFDGGQLLVYYPDSDGTAADRLTILDQGTGVGQIGVAGSDVTYEGTLIGTFSGGSGSTQLTIDFNAAATATSVQALVRAIAYHNVSENPSAPHNPRNVEFTLIDGGGSAGNSADEVAVAVLTLVSVNDAPSGADKTLAIDEDSSHTFTLADFGFTDVDGGGFAQVHVFFPSNGTLELDGVAAGDGLVVNVSDIIDGKLVFIPGADQNGTGYATIDFQVIDDGGTANGGVDKDPSADTFTFDVTAINDAPVNTVPGAQNIDEDSSVTFSAANGNAIAVADPDAGADDLIVTLSIADGTLTLAQIDGLSVTGDGTNSVELTGAVADVNAALDGLVYAPVADANGARTLTVAVNDNGFTGEDPALSGDEDDERDSDTVAITIAAVGDIAADAVSVAEDSGANILDLLGNDGFEDAGRAITGVGAAAHGSVGIDDNGTPGDATDDFVVYTPDPDYSGADSFSYTVTAGGVTEQAIVNLTVEAVNDAPANAVPGAQDIDEDSSLTFGAANGNAITIADVDAAGSNVTVTLSIEDGALTLAQTDSLVVTGDGSSTVELTGAIADINAALDGLVYAPPADANGTRTLTVTTSDNGHSGDDPGLTGDGDDERDSDTVGIDIGAVPDPGAAQDDSVATDEATMLNGSVFADNGSGGDSDADGLAVAAVNGESANVGAQIALPSGALLTLNADGTFEYDPNGVFDATPAAWSGASNMPATDSFSYTLAGGETATVTVTIAGLDSVDYLLGTGGSDALDGGVGADTMEGLAGNDQYEIDDTGDVVVELAGGGTDEVRSSISYTLAADLENLVLTGTAAIDGTGNDLSNILTGNGAGNVLSGGLAADTLNGDDGDDRLDGGDGSDKLRGGAGDDTYIVDRSGDQVTELAGAGTDTVESSATYTLAAEVENLVLTGAAAIDGTGNALGNRLTGNGAVNILNGAAGADTMAGLGGDDTYFVDDALDQVVEAAGEGDFDLVRSSVSFTLGANVERLLVLGNASVDGTGNDLANVITGNSGDNRLDGGLGADKLVGKAGNDIYVIDRASDRVVEDAGGGTDTVESSVTYTLASNVENLILTGAAAIDGTGNFAANTLTGNGAANILNGGSGADTMVGGSGNDTYFVDNAGDQAVEADGDGIDLVRSRVSFTLGAFVENLTLTGGLAIDGTGNGLANVINGNAGANRLDGGAGADKLNGKAGNDTYIVDDLGDQVSEDAANGGTDLVQSSVTFTLGLHVDNLALTGASAINGTGNATANTIAGNSANNILVGAGGDDTLDGDDGDDDLRGGLGNDDLEGGVGADDFVFDTALGASNVDHLLDFEVGTDRLVLENAIFTGLSAGPLSASAFTVGTSATDVNHRIIYDAATGNVWYDADGSGAGAKVLFAVLDTAPATLSASDFAVI